MIPQGTFIETQTILDILQEEYTKANPKFDQDITFDDFISRLLHWRESTTTFPSGRHLGVCKALATACIDSGGILSIYYKDEIHIKQMAQSILELIHGLVTVTTSKGLYLK